MIRTLFASAALALIACPVHAETLYVRAGHLVDPEAGTVLGARLLKVEDGRVAAVLPDGAVPRGARLVDWSAFTVLPGLIDCHVHLADTGQTSNVAEPLLHSAMEIAYIGARNARTTLMAGFTTVHDVGSFRVFADVELRNAINRGDVIGPRMQAVGAYITVPGGGGEVTGFSPDVRIPEDLRAGVVTDAADARAKVNYLFQHGADFDQTDRHRRRARQRHRGWPAGADRGRDARRSRSRRCARIVGHCACPPARLGSSPRSAGVRSIEHASLIDDEGIALAKAKGVWLDMDVYNGDYIADVGRREHWPENYLRKNDETTEAQREGFRKAVKAGVRLSFGTDAGVFPHGENARQFAYMVRFGMTPMQAIQAATTSAARAHGLGKDVGALSPGHYADMIAVPETPRQTSPC
jgi:imidazolonepropionase-like amidohydrolase